MQPSARLFAPPLGSASAKSSERPPVTISTSAPPSTSPLSSRRPSTQIHGRTSKRAPARQWNRRLSFSGGTGELSTSSRSSPRIRSNSIFSTAWGLDDDGLTIRPSSDPPALPPILAQPPFDMRVMTMELISTVQSGPDTPPLIESSLTASPVTVRKLRTRVLRRTKTSINDLPDELLLRILGHLSDQQGFRPLPGSSPDAPRWYTPPLRVALVCQRWLPLSRSLFYRSIRISHLARISAVHAACLTNAELPLFVRHLSIDLPISAADQLRLCAADQHVRAQPATSGTADSSPVKRREPLTRGDELRAVFQSCSHLLSLEISGVAPALLLASSSRSTSALHNLHQLRLSTVTRLVLRGGTGRSDRGGDGVPILDAPSVRDALLALTGLRCLTLSGYASALSPDEVLSFAPTRNHLGLAARPLPLRARAHAQMPLERLVLLECCFTPADLRALLEQCQRDRLRSLTVDDQWDAQTARRNRREGRWDQPTVEALHEVVDLVARSLEHLRVTLFNYPPVTGVAGAVASTALRSPERSGRRRSELGAHGSALISQYTGQILPRREAPTGVGTDRHILDSFISQLVALRTLNLGGSVVSPELFVPAPPPTSPKGALVASPEQRLDDPRPRLPRSVETLSLRSCDLLPPSALLPFLRSLIPAIPTTTATSSSFAVPLPPPRPTALHTLHTYGGSEHGWTRPGVALEIQQACWAAGVVWASSGSRPVRTGTAGSGSLEP